MGDHRAPVGDELHKLILRQADQGLPHRRAADGELLAQVIFNDKGAAGVFPGDDLVPDGEVDLVAFVGTGTALAIKNAPSGKNGDTDDILFINVYILYI